MEMEMTSRALSGQKGWVGRFMISFRGSEACEIRPLSRCRTSSIQTFENANRSEHSPGMKQQSQMSRQQQPDACQGDGPVQTSPTSRVKPTTCRVLARYHGAHTSDGATSAPPRFRNNTPNAHLLRCGPPRSVACAWHPHCSPIPQNQDLRIHAERRERTVPIEKRDVMFKSGETFAAAWFFLPEQARSRQRVPAVAMAHGIGYVKEMYLEPFARRFAAAGIAALAFDFRGVC